MNDRQRLEAIIAVVCKYLPPDGISIEKAMNEIISLVDPLPPQRTWVGLTDEQIDACWNKDLWKEKQPHHIFARAIEAKLKELNDHGI